MSPGAVQGEGLGLWSPASPSSQLTCGKCTPQAFLGRFPFFFVMLPAKPWSCSHTFGGVNYPEPIISSKTCESHGVNFLNFDITGTAVERELPAWAQVVLGKLHSHSSPPTK